jgi:hypothetical protein
LDTGGGAGDAAVLIATAAAASDFRVAIAADKAAIISS